MLRSFLYRVNVMMLFSVLLLTSCSPEEARPFKKQRIILASDCLTQKDVKLFRNFRRFKHISIQIVHISADSLMKKLKMEGLNTEIDAVLLSSSFEHWQMAQAKLFQKVKQEDLPELKSKWISPDHCSFAIGIDPYVVALPNDSVKRVRDYKDLTKDREWTSDLRGRSGWVPMLASVISKMNPKKRYNSFDWIKSFLSNKRSLSASDSLRSHLPVLSLYSHIIKHDKRNKNTVASIHFPNQFSGGCYYETRTFCVIKQARNYSNAIALLHYITSENGNRQINDRFSTFPVVEGTARIFDYQNKRFKRYNLSPFALERYYDRTIQLMGRSDFSEKLK